MKTGNEQSSFDGVKWGIFMETEINIWIKTGHWTIE
jgi:hypothetical protein